jgi:hypothetical protein
MSLETWLKSEDKKGFIYPPSHFGGFLPLQPDVDFKKRAKLRKKRDERIAKQLIEDEKYLNDLKKAGE